MFIIQVAPPGCQIPFAPSVAQNANPLIGASTVSEPSSTSGDSRTFTERQQGRFFFPAADDASAVDYTKEDLDDDNDGVVDSLLSLPKSKSPAPSDHIPLRPLDPGCPDGISRSRVPDVPSDLARAKLNVSLRTTAARPTMSSGGMRSLKRIRGAASMESDDAGFSNYRRSEDILPTLKDHGGHSSEQLRSGV